MESYEKLLDQAYEKVKQIDTSSDRFEIPKVEGHFEGKKTILTNFFQIVSHLRRDPDHFQKFILKELAASGQKDGDRFQKIEQYAKEFVLCRECKKPDTELVREDRITFVHCLACGAKHPVRGKI